MQFTAYNQEYQFLSDGVMGPSIWKNRMRTMHRMFRLPGSRQWWTEWGDLYPEEFQNLLDGLIREGEAAG
jgi:hypothetical protein